MPYIFNKLFSKRFPRKLKAPQLHATFKQNKALFVHIPKAAGSSISLTLFGHQVGHKKISDYYFSDFNKTESLFKFCFVRNPLTRFESSFNFLRNTSPFLSDRRMQGTLAQFDDINSFSEAFLSSPSNFQSLHFLPQYQFLNYTGNEKDKQLGIDFIGRFENIDKDFDHICQQINLAKTLPKINANKSISSSLNEENQQRLREFYDTDFYLFGYNL